MIDIQLTGLVKEFEVGKRILDGFSLQVDTGERVGLLGRNGAGKTTIFRIMTGQVHPDEGTVAIAPGKRLGLISQIPVYPEGYTVRTCWTPPSPRSMPWSGRWSSWPHRWGRTQPRRCWLDTTGCPPPSRRRGAMIPRLS